MLFGVPLVVTLTMGPFSFAEDPLLRSEEQVAEHAKTVWESGAINPASRSLTKGFKTILTHSHYTNYAAIFSPHPEAPKRRLRL
jgi:hypothetical protein